MRGVKASSYQAGRVGKADFWLSSRIKAGTWRKREMLSFPTILSRLPIYHPNGWAYLLGWWKVSWVLGNTLTLSSWYIPFCMPIYKVFQQNIYNSFFEKASRIQDWTLDTSQLWYHKEDSEPLLISTHVLPTLRPLSKRILMLFLTCQPRTNWTSWTGPLVIMVLRYHLHLRVVRLQEVSMNWRCPAHLHRNITMPPKSCKRGRTRQSTSGDSWVLVWWTSATVWTTQPLALSFPTWKRTTRSAMRLSRSFSSRTPLASSQLLLSTNSCRLVWAGPRPLF